MMKIKGVKLKSESAKRESEDKRPAPARHSQSATEKLDRKPLFSFPPDAVFN